MEVASAPSAATPTAMVYVHKNWSLLHILGYFLAIVFLLMFFAALWRHFFGVPSWMPFYNQQDAAEKAKRLAAKHLMINGFKCTGQALNDPVLVSSIDACGNMLDRSGNVAGAAVFDTAERTCQLYSSMGDLKDQNLDDFTLILPVCPSGSPIASWQPVSGKDVSDSSKVVIDSAKLGTLEKLQAVTAANTNYTAFVMNSVVDSNGNSKQVGGIRSSNVSAADSANPNKQFFSGPRI